ncbi:MAG: TolC family protein [Deltaproteobacteria bacterium]|nr:TolC family protein [Deltaproteobacteria bacterium]
MTRAGPLLLGLVIGTTSARAEQLSLRRALEYAAESAPEVRLAARLEAEARATRVGAGLITPVNPRANFDVRPSRETSGRALGFAGGLELAFDVSGAPALRVKEAAGRLAVARQGVGAARLAARHRAYRAYAAQQLARLRLVELGRAEAIARRVLAATEKRVAAGASGDTDTTSARVGLAKLRAEQIRAQAALVGRRMALLDALGSPPEAYLELSTPCDETALPATPGLGRSRELAISRRGELAELRARVALADVTLQRLRREVVPRVGVYGGVDASPASPVFGVVGLSVELPLLQRNQGPLAVGREVAETERTRLELARQRVLREVVGAHRAYDLAREQLRRISAEALPAADERLRLVELGWQAGRFDIFRLTAAAADAAELHLARVDALEACWQAWVGLLEATGAEGP